MGDQLWLWPTAGDDYAWQGPVEDPVARERRLRQRAADEVTAEDRIDYELWKVGLDPAHVLQLLMPRHHTPKGRRNAR